MLSETWRDIDGYEGFYQVSNLGQVKSLDRVIAHPRGPRKLKGRILRSGFSGRGDGCKIVVLWKDGFGTNKKVHRLVSVAWIGPCPDGYEVCHGKKGHSDDSVSNLRYDTKSSNMLDKRKDGTHGGRPVKRSDGVEFINVAVAAEETGCQATGIYKVCNNKRKTTGGYGWEYV